MCRRLQPSFCSVALAFGLIFPRSVLSWNIPGHMLSGAIAYQILRAESPTTITTVMVLLEKHPWYENHYIELDRLIILIEYCNEKLNLVEDAPPVMTIYNRRSYGSYL